MNHSFAAQAPTATTALHLAARRGAADAAEALLDGGADADARASNGRSALDLAAKHGHVGVVQLLLRRGAVVDRAGSESPLRLALEQRHEDVAHALLHARARLDHGAVELAKRVGSPALRRHVAARLAGDREARLDGQRARDDAEAAATAGELRRLAARC